MGDIHDSLYSLAMEYAKERNLKGEEFLRKISDLQEASKNKLNNIVNDKCDRCNNCDSNCFDHTNSLLVGRIFGQASKHA